MAGSLSDSAAATAWATGRIEHGNGSAAQSTDASLLFRFLLGAGWTYVFFASSTAVVFVMNRYPQVCCCCPHNNTSHHRNTNNNNKGLWSLDYRLLGSALLATAVGFLQVLFVVVYHNNDSVDFWAFAVHVNGVVAAVVSLIASYTLESLVLQWRRSGPRDGATVALTAERQDGDNRGGDIEDNSSIPSETSFDGDEEVHLDYDEELHLPRDIETSLALTPPNNENHEGESLTPSQNEQQQTEASDPSSSLAV